MERTETRTSTFVVGAVALELALGLGIALFLNQRLPGRRFLRAVALFPLMLTPVVLGITFRILFNYSTASSTTRSTGSASIRWSGWPRRPGP